MGSGDRRSETCFVLGSDTDDVLLVLMTRRQWDSGLPIIDLASLLAGGEVGFRRAATEVGRACREIGFFYISGHGIGDDAVAKLFATSRRFFELPLEIKESVPITRALSNYGCVALGDPERPGDAKEAFNVGRDLAADHPDVVAGKPFHQVNQWPDLPDFRPVLVRYFTTMQRLCELLHRAFTVDLRHASGFLPTVH